MFKLLVKLLESFSWNLNNKNKGFGMGTYIKIPMRIDAIKVPKNAKMQIVEKLEKNGFWDKKTCRLSKTQHPKLEIIG